MPHHTPDLRAREVVRHSAAHSRPVVDVDYAFADQVLMRSARRYFQWQHRLAKAQIGRRVLEVGCGTGNFTHLLADRELVVAVDVLSCCLEALRARCPDHAKLITRQMDLSDPEFVNLREFRPDSVVCLNVLEHVADDRAALGNMRSVLPGGGRIVLIVPAFPSLYGPIDANLGHYRRYTKRSLTALANSVGVRSVSMRYLNFVGFFGWWVNARVFKNEKQSPRQIACFDSVIVPVLSRVENFCQPPCGQSIFAVLEV